MHITQYNKPFINVIIYPVSHPYTDWCKQPCWDICLLFCFQFKTYVFHWMWKKVIKHPITLMVRIKDDSDQKHTLKFDRCLDTTTSYEDTRILKIITNKKTGRSWSGCDYASVTDFWILLLWDFYLRYGGQRQPHAFSNSTQ